MIKYRGEPPTQNYTTKDFYDNGIVISGFIRYKDKNGLKVIFRSNGLLGIIRTTCYGNTFAVDVWWGQGSNEKTCLTTECKSLREAKSILFVWFKSKGFRLPKSYTDSNPYLQYYP